MEKKGQQKRKDKVGIVLRKPRKKYLCITCPKGCALETDGTQVKGARCEKGEAFACQEWIEPLRVLTTTVRCETETGMRIVPVKTASPVPLSRLAPIMKEIKGLRLSGVPPIGSKMPIPGLTEPLEIIVTGE